MDVFKCQRCGTCCQGEGGIVVSFKERTRLADHLGIDEPTFRERYARPQGDKWVLQSGDDGYCIFFRKGVGCEVHTVKPDVCRAWPFFRGNILDPISWQLAQDSCPGINAAAGHARFAEEGRRYLTAQRLLKTGQPDEATALILPPQETA